EADGDPRRPLPQGQEGQQRQRPQPQDHRPPARLHYDFPSSRSTASSTPVSKNASGFHLSAGPVRLPVPTWKARFSAAPAPRRRSSPPSASKTLTSARSCASSRASSSSLSAGPRSRTQN